MYTEEDYESLDDNKRPEFSNMSIKNLNLKLKEFKVN